MSQRIERAFPQPNKEIEYRKNQSDLSRTEAAKLRKREPRC